MTTHTLANTSATLSYTLSNTSYNPFVIAASATLQAGLYGEKGADWSITSYGSLAETITATLSAGQPALGVVSEASAVLLVSASTFTNKGNITASGNVSAGVDLTAGGTVVNDGGTITQSGAFGYGVALETGGSLTNTNAGTIESTVGESYGVVFGGDGSVSNASSAVINGAGTLGTGLSFYGAALTGTVTNGGTIEGGNYGVYIQSGLVTNLAGGLIKGTDGQSIKISNQATVVNHGMVSTSGTNVPAIGVSEFKTVASYITNAPLAVISAGDGTGIAFYNTGGTGTKSATVTNAGSIVGAATAIRFAAGANNLLVVDPAAYFHGTVDGGNTVGGSASSTLELASGASTGTLSGLGSTYVHFNRVTIDPGATWDFTGTNTLVSGAVLTDSGTLQNNGVILLDPSTMNAAALIGTGAVSLGSGSTIQLSGTVASAQTVVMTGTDDVLNIGGGSLFSGAIAGFGGTGIIDVQSIGLADSAKTLGNALVLYSGETRLFSFSDITNGSSSVVNPAFIRLVDDGHGGTDVACYLRGTRIRTERGEVPVEFLSVGDSVVTLSGALQPIRWIGRRRYVVTQTEGHASVLPVLIRAGAVADGIPRRDLYLSPEHAVYIDGLLVPARHLTNGVSIEQRHDFDVLDYFHIELAAHDVVLAEGLAAETFADCDSREMFDNAFTYTGGGSPCWMFYAPRVEEGEAIADMRQRLNARAGIDPGDGTVGPLEGNFEGWSAGFLEGWAQDVSAPERPVWLEIVADGVVVKRIVANRHRNDLAMAGRGSGRQAFRVLFSHNARRVEVRRVEDGRLLGAWESAFAG